MKKILLVGNPNVGKSAIFSHLTGIDIMTANYPGTTVEFTKGFLKIGNEKCEIIDIPGTYTLEPTSKAEEVAVEMLKEGDIIINVLDSTNLERNLNLTLQLLLQKKPIILVLNFWDETKHTGITINAKKLEEILHIPVIPTCAITGEGLLEIVSNINEAKISNFEYDTNERWHIIGNIIEETQKVTHKHHTLLDRLSDITIKPVTGIPSAIFILIAAFVIVRFIGEGLINYLLDPFFNKFYLPYIIKLYDITPSLFLKNIVFGKTLVAMESFGVLTTGIYIPFVVVLPYILSFYIVLSLLEDLGYLPRLAVLLDSTFHHFGLHGYSSIPILLGLGCKVPALLSIRILENEREKILTTILILMSAPCMPQTAMIMSLGVKYGLKAVILIFLIIILIAIITSSILNKIMKGEVSELFVEIPPYRIPKFNVLSKKVWIRMKNFFSEAVPLIILGVLIINIMDILHITDFISNKIGGFIINFMGLPEKTISVMLLGFLRKDVSIAMLSPFSLSTKQFIIACIFMVLYLPCIASFFVLIKEMGIKSTLKIVSLILLIAIFAAALLNAVL
ncbi:MAG: ferrous iron transporter B [Elusimicrobia bacterium RIFOXYD2_FULL_34_30]|nr:MAG: ferrous iron transporter B [Elusimicrobia bacterium RIFOXYD2_FULL_34_30]